MHYYMAWCFSHLNDLFYKPHTRIKRGAWNTLCVPTHHSRFCFHTIKISLFWGYVNVKNLMLQSTVLMYLSCAFLKSLHASPPLLH